MDSNVFQSNIGTDYLMEKKIEIMIDMSNKKLANELNNLKSMISSLSSEISEIKQNLRARPAMTNRTLVCEEATQEREEPIQVATVKSAPKEETQAKPRYGDYKSQDVAIDKFFYCGKREN